MTIEANMTGRELITLLLREVVDLDRPGIRVGIESHGQAYYTHSIFMDDVPIIEWSVDLEPGRERG